MPGPFFIAGLEGEKQKKARRKHMKILKKAGAMLLAALTVVTSVYAPITAQAAETTPTRANLTVGARYEYTGHGYGTHYFTLDFEDGDSYSDNGYCIQPKKSNPGNGSYSVTLVTDAGMRKLLYYSAGAPGAEVSGMTAEKNPNGRNGAFAGSHAVLSCYYGERVTNDSDWAYDLDAEQIQGVEATMNAMLSLPEPPKGFEAYYVNTSGDNSKQMLIAWRNPALQEGKGRLVKISEHPEISEGNSCYSLAGAEYTIYDQSGAAVGTLVTDETGNSSESGDLEEGTYTVKETKASKGYGLDPQTYTVNVVAGQTMSFESCEPLVLDPATVEVYKEDADGNTIYSLAGTEFTVNFYGGYYDSNNLPAAPLRSWVIATKDIQGHCYAQLNEDFLISGDPFYSTGANVLPLGTITIQETKPAEHYTDTVTKVTDKDGNEVSVVGGNMVIGQIREGANGVGYLSFGNKATFSDEIKKGGVAVQKFDLELGEAQAQGSATLAGATIDIINDNEGTAVNADGIGAEQGEVILTLTTDENGYATSGEGALPEGNYIARETVAPNGYLLDKRYDGSACNGVVLEQAFSVVGGEITQLTSLDTGIVDQVKRGGVKIQKFDFDSKLPESQGTPDLSGATFDIISLNDNPVTDYDRNRFEKGNVVYTLTTDEYGVAETDDRALPVGHYKVVETAPPEGYFLWGILEREFTITEDGEIAQLTSYDNSISDRVKRGDLTFLKKDEDNKPMADIPFRITLLDNHGNVKESHITYTDDNGKLTTKNRKGVQHSTNTNANDSAEIGKGSWKNGIWFGKAPVDDTMGALPYGNYVIQELRCEANKKYDLISFYVTIHPELMDDDDLEHYEATPLDNNFLLDEGTLHDTLNNSNYVIKSLAYNSLITDKAGDNAIRTLSAAEDQSITDEVTWEFDNPKFTEYVVVSEIMDKSTGKPFVDAFGKSFRTETKLSTEGKSHGSFNVTFDGINLYGMTGKELVIFEYLYESKAYAAGGAVNTLADDTDLENVKQTLYVPGLGTTAKDGATGDEVGAVAEKATIIDTVSYSNLNKGFEYTVKGTLMDKETGKPFLDKDGKEITAEKKFFPEAPSGTVDVTFEFDASLLKGKTIVVFEDLYSRDKLLYSHADINDVPQTVYYPEIGTTASTGIKDNEHQAAAIDEEITITDTVAYKNLVPGKKYVVKGTLMDKETGKPFQSVTASADVTTGSAISAISAPYTAEQEFTPEASEGTVDLTFKVNGKDLAGKTIVVFEDLYHNDVEVTSHADIEDEDQTVYFPELGTKASVDGKNEVETATETKLVDTVSYKNLVPGKEYKVTGKLMLKETGEALKDKDGKEITKEVTFTPEQADGTIDVEFSFDSSDLAGKTVVVFEKAFYGETEIASHEDLSDEGQSVKFLEKPETPPTTPPAPQTFDNTKTIPAGIFLGGAGLLALALALVNRKKKQVKAK